MKNNVCMVYLIFVCALTTCASLLSASDIETNLNVGVDNESQESAWKTFVSAESPIHAYRALSEYRSQASASLSPQQWIYIVGVFLKVLIPVWIVQLIFLLLLIFIRIFPKRKVFYLLSICVVLSMLLSVQFVDTHEWAVSRSSIQLYGAPDEHAYVCSAVERAYCLSCYEKRGDWIRVGNREKIGWVKRADVDLIRRA